jgi:glycosyltransferase involved in cell wall biosynthesis
VTAARSVVFVAPEDVGVRTGNETSVRRLERALVRHGVAVRVLRPSELEAGRQPAPADLVHAFHARRCGPAAQALAGKLGVPLVVTLTGTDIDVDAFQDDRQRIVREVVAAADVVICGHEGAREGVMRLLGCTDCAHVVPKGVEIPDPLPAPAFASPGRLSVLQVAHVRPVKNNLLAVRVVTDLAAQGFPIALRILGDVLDAQYEQRLIEAAGGRAVWDGIRHPPLPHAAVGAWYCGADVVLNTSDGEGGSNAILEAMAHGRAVLASDIPGNRAYVGTEGDRGLLYRATVSEDGSVRHDEHGLAQALVRLADASLRARLGAAARVWVAHEHGVDTEVARVLDLYSTALSK